MTAVLSAKVPDEYQNLKVTVTFEDGASVCIRRPKGGNEIEIKSVNAQGLPDALFKIPVDALIPLGILPLAR
jgi:hypothetical protein